MEVDEAVVLPLGPEPSPRNGRGAADNARMYPQQGPRVRGVTGEEVCVRRAPDLHALAQQLRVGCCRLLQAALPWGRPA